LIICFETTPIAASMADQETKAYRRCTSFEAEAQRRTQAEELSCFARNGVARGRKF